MTESSVIKRGLDIREVCFRPLPPVDQVYEEITDPEQIAWWKVRFEQEIEKVKRVTLSREAFDAFLQQCRKEGGFFMHPPPTFEETVDLLRILETQRFIPGLSERLFSIKVK
jgi:hypothetical protein